MVVNSLRRGIIVYDMTSETTHASPLPSAGRSLRHEKEQIMMHVDFSYCAKKGQEPLVHQFDEHISPIRSYPKERQKLNCPLIFIDKNVAKKLPDEEVLSMFTMVITTPQRLTKEWKNGSFKEELTTTNGKFLRRYKVRGDPTEASSLLKIRWTRLIVDEGYAIGSRGKDTKAIEFASWISAQRRWVVTGTPRPQTDFGSGMSNMNNMLNFLQPNFSGSPFIGDTIFESWNNCQIVSYFRFRNLIAMYMIRHAKYNIAELPLPRFTIKCVHLSVQEIMTYNTLVSAVQSNILFTSMKGKVKGLQDSLLHGLQKKVATDALNSLRLSCTGGIHVTPTLTDATLNEMKDVLIRNKVDPIDIKGIENYLHRAVTGEMTNCMCCGIQLNTMLVMMCAHLVCTECVTTDTKSCPVCDLPFNVDEFKLFQPCLSYKWVWNFENSITPRNAVIVPSVDGNISVLVQGDGRLSAPDRVPMRPGVLPAAQRRQSSRGHVCSYDATTTHGRCLFCFEEHAECVMVSERSRCAKCYRQAKACPEEESKFFYVIQKLQDLQLEYSSRLSIQSKTTTEDSSGENITQNQPRKPKIIVFSQFQSVLNAFGHRLLSRFGAGCVAEYWSPLLSEELEKFSKCNDCFCMLLDKDGSKGLKLSFVT